MNKSIFFAALLAAGFAQAEAELPAPFVPEIEACLVPMTMRAGLISLRSEYVNESCMQRQEVRSAVEFCAEFPDQCTRTMVIVGDIPLVTEYPKQDSVFFDLVSYSYGLDQQVNEVEVEVVSEK